jgi:hypothetical protein
VKQVCQAGVSSKPNDVIQNSFHRDKVYPMHDEIEILASPIIISSAFFVYDGQQQFIQTLFLNVYIFNLHCN